LVQPDYRHNATVSWVFDRGQVQLDWQRIGGVVDSTPGENDKIPAQDYFNLNSSWRVLSWLTANFGINNLLGKDPPFVPTSGTFNTFPDTYDVIGRAFSFSLTARH